MPAAKVQDEQVLEGLTEVFQLHGYEGASLSRLADATGLQRASLYHRFPGGKEEMAEVVLERAFAWLREHVLEPLGGPGAPVERVEEMKKCLEEFYQRGNRSCLLDTLSLGDREGTFSKQIRAAMHAWLTSMTSVAIEAGLEREKARQRAEEALVRIHGGLVVARATGDPSAFRRAVESLPTQLTQY